jgi:hypothetical protein
MSSLLHISLSVVLLMAMAVPGRADDATFRAGAATADLTPGQGVSMDGPISKPGPVRGVHDRLTARALVLSLGPQSVLFVVNDMCMIDREVYDEAKQIVERQTGIPMSNQLMAATHSHATPRVARISQREPDEAYRKFVARRIAEAAIAAHRNLAPAKIGLGTFNRPELLASRRFLCEVGSVAVNPFGETDERIKSVSGAGKVVQPAGMIDPQFSVLSVRHADGRPLAVLGNFSVHYCGGYEAGQVSADYFGVYARRLEERLSSGSDTAPFVGIMSNGTSGDTGAFQGGPTRAAPWSRMEHFGKLLADETVELLGRIEHRVPRELAMVASELPLGIRKPDSERIAWAQQLLAATGEQGPHRWSRIYAEDALRLDQMPDQYAIPLAAIRIDDIGIAACPCEVFAETGLAIKKSSPLKHTFTMELANGYGGYLPTPKQHALGGYETWPARSSHLEVDAEPKIRGELLRLLEKAASSSAVERRQ